MDKHLHPICLHCKEIFIPNRHAPHARYCSRPICRKASKKVSQARWLNQPENRDYFCGPDQVKRVQAWRKENPGYWRKSKVRRGKRPLQDIVALQDLVHSPVTMALLGFFSAQTGNALQDTVEKTFWNMHFRGQAIMGIVSGIEKKGRFHANV